MPEKICIGTAQFGLTYGITNTEGQVQQDQVKKLLLLAQQLNIDYLDTAQAYGNSEQILGLSLPPKSKFHIVSKLKSQQEKLSFSEKDLYPLAEIVFVNPLNLAIFSVTEPTQKHLIFFFSPFTFKFFTAFELVNISAL